MKIQADRIECAQCRQMVKAQTARKSAPTPLAETPIYAELKAEFDMARRQAIKIATIAYTGAGPLLKNGRKP